MESVIATREEVQGFLSQNNINYSFGSGESYVEVDVKDYGGGSGRGNGNFDSSGYGGDVGSCEGDGYCGGDGDIQELNGNIVDYIDTVPTIITQVHGNLALGFVIRNNLTLKPCFIAKIGNSFAHGETLKAAVAAAEEKAIKNTPIKERIKKFKEVFGSLDSEHTGSEFYDWHHVLTGSCRMGRDKFCMENGIYLYEKYTVRYFLQITKDAYGGEIIKEVIDSYGRKEE